MLAKFSRVVCVAGAKSPSPFDACYAGYSRVECPKKREKTAFVLCSPTPGGAGSEVWNRVYMIAPVKKPRDRVQIFLENKYGRECGHGRTRSFCSVLSFPAYKYQEKVSMNFFNGLFGHQEAS